MPDQRVTHKRLSEVVADRIKDYIIEHSLSEGDRLPTEHEMAELFGVSRLSVREATKALSFLGIINSAPKRGLTVGGVDMHRVTQYLGFHFSLNGYPKAQLLKTRLVIEIGALSEVMDRMADDENVYTQLMAINDKVDNLNDADQFIQRDLAFHRALLEASNIEPLVAFSDLLAIFFKKFRDEVVTAKRHWSNGVAMHREILDALRNKELENAERILRQHLEHYKGHL